MRFFSVRSLALATLVPALVLFAVVPGCAKQSEGERCGDSFGAGASEDCGDGLTCTKFGPDGDNRCCYSDGHVNDSRCELTTPGSNGGAGGGPAAAAGSSSVAGGSSVPEAGAGGEGS